MMNLSSLGSRRKPAVLLALAATVLLFDAGCDDKLRGSGSPDIVANPASVSFGKVNIDESVDETVRIQNNGDGTLIVSNIVMNLGDTEDYQLYWSTRDDAETAFVGIDKEGGNHFDFPFEIESRGELFLFVNYAPTDDTPERGEIIISTNVEGKREFEIPIGTADVAPEISVSPGVYDFGHVSPIPEGSDDEIKYVDITISSIGQLPLSIDKLTLSGSQEFTPLIEGRDFRRPGNEGLITDPDNDNEPGLSPDTTFVIRVQYNPLTQGPDAAQLVIESNDPVQPAVTVSLTANGATPCINVVPAAVEFPASLVNREDSRPIQIESCGGGALEISSIELDPSSDPGFALVPSSLPSFPTILPAASPEMAPPSREIQIAFTPHEERVYHGKLIIRTNDPSAPEKFVSLLGRGVLNACPQGRANPEEFNVPPLEVIRLDGSASVDPDGPDNRPIKYEWVVKESPQGSTSIAREAIPDLADPTQGPNDDELTPSALFFVDLAGTYTLELHVTDNLMLSSRECETSAVVTIVAKPAEAIHVQVVWTSPEDPDQTDRQGTDVDLHLLHPLGEGWRASPGDAYYGNPNPDWGILLKESDNPVLDIDDINGSGPENISLAEPENTAELENPYKVALHYYSSRERVSGEDFGASTATVRIFLNSELNLTIEDVELPAQDAFCELATIEWPAAVATEARQCFDSPP